MIPGFIISALTFPGVIIHEWAHKKYCDWTGVAVHKVVYFQFGNTAGYVLHEHPQKYNQIFWISVGPLVINSVMAVVLSYFAMQAQADSGLYFLFLWVAVSAGMHAFPSDKDAKNVFDESNHLLKNGGSSLHYLAYPFFALIWIANKLSFVWFDLWYALILMSIGGVFQF